ncbi:uncharacterized protein LOC119998777 [Tripterygium wilfordii]|uniref:uncharacterized protein LOC119998777 n=1 Tax=Tripterygium wilfordii TaxID=458696 RepID=UPI0018F8076D|nr:uncharacterized protein LOC119998777 [Tripterygium wilfordii]XP_038702124.1 uncharacterized protein LOC119998777 [Tripterygium wilfordii]
MPPKTRTLRDIAVREETGESLAPQSAHITREQGRRRRTTTVVGEGVQSEGIALPPLVQADADVPGLSEVQGPTMIDMMAGMQGIQQAILKLTEVVTVQSQRVTQPLVDQTPTAGGRQTVQDQPQPQLGGGIMVTLPEFLKLKPPKFSGSDVNEDPQRFLDSMDRVLQALGCSSTRSVELAAFQLEDIARTWYDTLRGGRLVGSASLRWEEFTEAFMARFLPRSVREARAHEFEKLVQTFGMTVTEYDILFTRLSRYAPHLVATEEMRITRFVNGLVTPLFNAVASQEFTTYAAAVDRVRKIEIRRLEDRGGQEQSKKSRTVGSFSGFSRSVDSQKSGKQRAAQSEMGSSAYSPSIALRRDSRFQDAEHSGQQPPSQFSADRPPCLTCGKRHSGQCYRATGACFKCGQLGHRMWECPQGQNISSVGSAPLITPATGQPTRQTTVQSGRGFGVRGQDQSRGGPARVFALTPQDMQTSDADVAGTLSSYSFDPHVLIALDSTYQILPSDSLKIQICLVALSVIGNFVPSLVLYSGLILLLFEQFDNIY